MKTTAESNITSNAAQPNIYRKLITARQKMQSQEIKKSGRNTHSKYSYMELKDFLPAALKIFEEVGLCGVISFTSDVASMTVFDADNSSETIVITSPMGSAKLPTCHEVQNIGAVETYQRRYLWMAALEIIEHDAIDSGAGAEEEQTVSEEQQVAIQSLLDETGSDGSKFCRFFKVEALSELHAKDYERAVAMLEKKRKEAA